MQEMQERQVQFLGREDLWEEEMATHTGILTWEILWTEETGGLWGHKRVRQDLAAKQRQQPPLWLLVLL